MDVDNFWFFFFFPFSDKLEEALQKQELYEEEIDQVKGMNCTEKQNKHKQQDTRIGKKARIGIMPEDFPAPTYYLLYLKINNSEFQIILLDHITYH